MRFIGDARERRKLFTLLSGDEEQDAVGRIIVYLTKRDDVLRFKEFERADNLKIRFHTSAFNRDFLSQAFRYLDDADDAFHLGSERTDDHSSLCRPYDFLYVLNDLAFGQRKTAFFDGR